MPSSFGHLSDLGCVAKLVKPPLSRKFVFGAIPRLPSERRVGLNTKRGVCEGIHRRELVLQCALEGWPIRSPSSAVFTGGIEGCFTESLNFLLDPLRKCAVWVLLCACDSVFHCVF